MDLFKLTLTLLLLILTANAEETLGLEIINPIDMLDKLSDMTWRIPQNMEKQRIAANQTVYDNYCWFPPHTLESMETGQRRRFVRFTQEHRREVFEWFCRHDESYAPMVNAAMAGDPTVPQPPPTFEPLKPYLECGIMLGRVPCREHAKIRRRSKIGNFFTHLGKRIKEIFTHPNAEGFFDFACSHMCLVRFMCPACLIEKLVPDAKHCPTEADIQEIMCAAKQSVDENYNENGQQIGDGAKMPSMSAAKHKRAAPASMTPPAFSIADATSTETPKPTTSSPSSSEVPTVRTTTSTSKTTTTSSSPGKTPTADLNPPAPKTVPKSCPLRLTPDGGSWRAPSSMVALDTSQPSKVFKPSRIAIVNAPAAVPHHGNETVATFDVPASFVNQRCSVYIAIPERAQPPKKAGVKPFISAGKKADAGVPFDSGYVLDSSTAKSPAGLIPGELHFTTLAGPVNETGVSVDWLPMAHTKLPEWRPYERSKREIWRGACPASGTLTILVTGRKGIVLSWRQGWNAEGCPVGLYMTTK